MGALFLVHETRQSAGATWLTLVVFSIKNELFFDIYRTGVVLLSFEDLF